MLEATEDMIEVPPSMDNNPVDTNSLENDEDREEDDGDLNNGNEHEPK